MASTYSDNLKLQLMATGENAGTWGAITNVNLATALEQAIVESVTVPFSSANVTLTLTDDNAAQDARAFRLNLTGTTGGARDLIVPAIEKPYIVNNGTADIITIKVSGQTGVAIPVGKSMLVYNNGTDVINPLTQVNADVSGNVTGNLTGTASNATVLATARNFEISNGATAAAVSFDGSGAVNLNVTGINASVIDTGTIANARTTAASANGASTIVLRDASGDFSAHNVTANMVTGLTTPLNSTDATNKTYVDALIASGVHFHQPVRVESPTNLNASYNNGTDGVGATLTNAGTQVALEIDGVSVNVADRVLIYQQTTQTQNGVYVVSDVGSGSTNWVLTRATDADSYEISSPNGLSEGSTFFVQEGATGAGETYTCNTVGTITFGTTNITFAQISSAQIYSANTSTGINLSGTTFFLDVVPIANGGTGSNTATFSGENITSINASNISSGTIDNARTTASSSNGASTIVLRDASGDFSANIITANGSSITSINAANISSGTLDPARLGTAENVQFGSLGVGTAASGTTGEIRATNNVTAYYSSDRKFKENIREIDGALEKVTAIGGKYFDWSDAYIAEHGGADGYFVSKSDFGVIAQDVQSVFPVAVRTRDDGSLAVDYEKLCSLAFAAIRELKIRVEKLEG